MPSAPVERWPYAILVGLVDAGFVVIAGDTLVRVSTSPGGGCANGNPSAPKQYMDDYGCLWSAIVWDSLTI